MKINHIITEFVTPQATAQDPGLEREKDVDVIFYGQMPQDFTANTVAEALEEVLPREYPPGSSNTTNSNVYRVVTEIAKHQGAVVTNKPLSVAQKLVKTFQTYGIKCKIDAPELEEDVKVPGPMRMNDYHDQADAIQEKLRQAIQTGNKQLIQQLSKQRDDLDAHVKTHGMMPEDITRRGFLKGAGAAAVAGATGGAMADRSWSQDELTKQWQGTMTSETFKGAVIHWDEERKVASVALTEPTNFSPNNIKQNRLYFPKITTGNFTIKIGDSNPLNGTGTTYTFPLRQLGDYKGNGLILFQGQKFTAIRNEFIGADKVLLRLDVDGIPTTITFHDNPAAIQQRQSQKKQPVLDKIYQEERAGDRISGFHGIYSAVQLRTMLEQYKDQIPEKFNSLDQQINTLISNTQGHQISKDIEDQLKTENFLKTTKEYKQANNVETVNRWLSSVYPEVLKRLQKYNSMLSSVNESVEQGLEEASRPPVAPDPQNYDSDWDYYNDRDADVMTDSDPADDMTDDKPDDWFDESKEKVGNMDADAFDAALSRMKKLAGAGPLRTVYDPARRVYKNVPHAVQPAQQPKKAR